MVEPPAYKPPLPPVPAVAPDGTILVNASKYARQATLAVFEMLGGTHAMAEWARENPTDFYTKLFPKTIQKDVEVGTRDDVEGMLEKLDQKPYQNDDAIDAEFVMLPDGYDAD